MVWAISLSRRDLQLSLRSRIIATLSVVLAGAAVILGLAAWQYSSVAAQQAYDRLLSGATIQIAENVYVQGGVAALDPPVAAIATLSAYDMVFYKVVDPRGIVVAGYGELASTATESAARSGVVLEDGVYQGQIVRIATMARQIGYPAQAGMGNDRGRPDQGRVVGPRARTDKALTVIAVMSALALLAASFAIGLALKPLTKIESEIANRRADDLSPIHAEPPFEIRSLVFAIDGFMQRLADRMNLMQRFIANASHQIRTPLAALDAQVELLSTTKSPQRRAEYLARIRDRTAQLARLTNQLLDHAMVIHRADAAQAAPVGLNELARSVLASAVPLSMSREVDIAFEPADPAPVVMGNAISIREALGNLIHNALVHGARSRLTIAIGQNGDSAWIEVRDDGAVFDPTIAEQLIAPFAKGESSSGSGLGLSIADQVARAHGGSLSFARCDGLTIVRLSIRGGAA